MPTYEFRCEAGHSFDRFLKMSEAPTELACDVCGKQATRQVSGGAGLVFKGSGFYLTDYGRAGQKPAGGAAAVSGDTKPADAKSSQSDAAPVAPAPAPKSDTASSIKSSKPSE